MVEFLTRYNVDIVRNCIGVMMICKKCRKGEPKYFFRCYLGSVIGDLPLCEDCMSSIGDEEDVVGFLGEDVITKAGNASSIIQQEIDKVADLECSNCHTTIATVGQIAKFGCENCYDVFSDLIMIGEASIEQQLNEQSISSDFDSENSVPAGRIDMLKARLQNAIDSEDFEYAAKIRDQLKSLGVNDND